MPDLKENKTIYIFKDGDHVIIAGRVGDVKVSHEYDIEQGQDTPKAHLEAINRTARNMWLVQKGGPELLDKYIEGKMDPKDIRGIMNPPKDYYRILEPKT